MKESIIKGTCFGLTSGIITTLGLMVGLHSGTKSEMVVLGGIITIAIADAFSDSLGIHISEESANNSTTKEIWAATIFTFLSKFLFAMLFVIPVLLFSIDIAVVVSVIFGFLMLALLSFFIAKDQGEKPWKVVGEHLLIATVVVVATHYVGVFVNHVFM